MKKVVGSMRDVGVQMRLSFIRRLGLHWEGLFWRKE